MPGQASGLMSVKKTVRHSIARSAKSILTVGPAYEQKRASVPPSGDCTILDAKLEPALQAI